MDDGRTMLPLHLGNLHPVEQVIVLLIAFGPFLMAIGVAVWLRRQDDSEEE